LPPLAGEGFCEVGEATVPDAGEEGAGLPVGLTTEPEGEGETGPEPLEYPPLGAGLSLGLTAVPDGEDATGPEAEL